MVDLDNYMTNKPIWYNYFLNFLFGLFAAKVERPTALNLANEDEHSGSQIENPQKESSNAGTLVQICFPSNG